MTAGPARSAPATPAHEGGDLVKRHRLSTRIWHWTTVAAFLIMLMSGLTIFNAHPRLYWGEYGANPDPSWLEIGNAGKTGFARIGDVTFDTTGAFGVWTDADGDRIARAFPSWATLPSGYDLALGRRWHLTFSWVFAAGFGLYAAWSLLNGHVRRDLLPSRSEMAPRHVWSEIKNHARLRLPRGADALKFNTLQKASYLAVIFVLIPVMILTGLTMSPSIDAAMPWLLDLFGGRQSARSIHFIAAMALVLFVIVHLVMVLLAGPFNEIRSMLTGWFRLPKEKNR